MQYSNLSLDYLCCIFPMNIKYFTLAEHSLSKVQSEVHSVGVEWE